MSVNCADVIKIMNKFAPAELAMAEDPIGLQLGRLEQPVNKLFVALELDEQVLQEALSFGADLIVVHHTPFFKPLQQLCEDDAHNRLIVQMIRQGVALYTAHTNLDCAPGGVNDVLASLLGLEDVSILESLNTHQSNAGLGRIGRLPQPQNLQEFAAFTAKCLNTPTLRYCGRPQTIVTRVACCGGSGAFLMRTALEKGAEVYVTADIKHHEAQQALEWGLCLIDGGHYGTERPAMTALAQYLQKEIPQIDIKESHLNTDPFRHLPGAL